MKIMIDVSDGFYKTLEHFRADGIALGKAERAILDGEIVQGWIPVTERLPQTKGQYLMFLEDYEDASITSYDVGYYDKQEEKWSSHQLHDWYGWEVVAWMPLPQPYGKE